MTMASLYFHSPCFDGIASAVLVGDFLESRCSWPPPTLRSVNYDRRETWLAEKLEGRVAIVDFLYHPAAEFWADHHLSAFLDASARSHFVQRAGPLLVYDTAADSCAGLLWRHLTETFGSRNPKYAELVSWANKIDAARYASVDEVMTAAAPALQINLGLAVDGNASFCEALVQGLRGQSLADVANRPEVRDRYTRAQALIEMGLDRFKHRAHLEEDGIVVFDVDSTDAIVSRYAPFYFFPQASYSVGVVRWEGGAKVTAMRNPWREFQSVPLGQLAERLGGGGHQRVGSIALRGERVNRAATILAEFLTEIRRRHSQAPA